MFTGQKYHVNREHIFVFDLANISNDHFLPLHLYKFSTSVNHGFVMMVQLLIRLISLKILKAFISASVPSLIIEIASTNSNGPHAVNGVKGLIAGIVCKIAITKKKTLARRAN